MTSRIDPAQNRLRVPKRIINVHPSPARLHSFNDRPAATSDVASPQSPQHTPEFGLPLCRLSPVHILVISPEQGIQLLLRSILNAIPHYHCDAIGTWDLQKDFSPKRDYHIVIVDDCTRTATEALECLRKIKHQLPPDQHIRSLACTLSDHPLDHDQFYLAGFDACLAKPFSKRALLQRIALLVH